MTPEELDQINKRHLAWFHSEPSTADWSPAAHFAGTSATEDEMAFEIVRNDVPALVDEVRAQRAEIARLQNIIALLEV